LAHLRAVVTTWETDDTQGLDYAYTLAIREDPTRAMTQLRNLARGHALSQGRNYLTLHDLPLLIKVVLSTASLERVRVFEILLEHKGKLTTSMITKSLNTSYNTAKRTMAELIAIGLVTLGEVHVESEDNTTTQKEITLVEKFNWFLSEEFSAVRNLPPYYNEDTTQKCIVQDKRLAGHFSYTAYPTIVLLNSILPRTGVVN
jgi:predicted transcriptional regulator